MVDVKPKPDEGPGYSGLPVLRWRWVVFVAIIAVLATAAFMWYLLTEVATATNPALASTQIDAIKTALSLAVGTGGALALWLAARRQRSTELQLSENARIEADKKVQADKTALFTEFDLRERRITDIYAKSVEQLGHDNAAVRLGALYALERLARENPAHRQTVVNVICAYLRMPFHEPTRRPPRGPIDLNDIKADELARLSERNTRKAAQDILIRNLEKLSPEETGEAATREPWTDIDIDLSEAVLVDFRLIDCSVRKASFANTRFTTVARFDNTEFQEDAWFFHSKFDSANAFFESARFCKRAIFTGTEFGLTARFNNVCFQQHAMFYSAIFRALVDFKKAKFHDGFDFTRCQLRAISADQGKDDSWGLPRFRFDEVTLELASADSKYISPPGWSVESAGNGSEAALNIRESSLEIESHER